MPWTEQQIRYLLSSASPLSEAQKERMKRELHNHPDYVKPKKPS
jgi:hypothetical protein